MVQAIAVQLACGADEFVAVNDEIDRFTANTAYSTIPTADAVGYMLSPLRG
jgi:hypothetical protein